MLRSSLALCLGTALVACSSTPVKDTAPIDDAGSAEIVDATVPESDAGGVFDAGTDAQVVTPLEMPAGYTQVPYLSDAPVTKFTQADSVLLPSTDYVAVLETDAGRIVLDLYEDKTPITVNSFVFLALHHFYEQTAFHRVIEGFMAQGGDPNSVKGKRNTWGSGGPGYSFGTEADAGLSFDDAGVLGMARADSLDSNGSQFFITFDAATFLDGQYTVWGRVTEGLDTLPTIVRGEPPQTPTRVSRVGIGAKPR